MQIDPSEHIDLGTNPLGLQPRRCKSGLRQRRPTSPAFNGRPFKKLEDAVLSELLETRESTLHQHFDPAQAPRPELWAGHISRGLAGAEGE